MRGAGHAWKDPQGPSLEGSFTAFLSRIECPSECFTGPVHARVMQIVAQWRLPSWLGSETRRTVCGGTGTDSASQEELGIRPAADRFSTKLGTQCWRLSSTLQDQWSGLAVQVRQPFNLCLRASSLCSRRENYVLGKSVCSELSQARSLCRALPHLEPTAPWPRWRRPASLGLGLASIKKPGGLFAV